ncbi:MAG: LysR family transcriptional regulator [Synergistaceae bacterium]|nr:LysR family transcriptional regulator [Synergistaceae bacterium]
MLLRQMKYFTAVVECGSFTEAAAECFISQSAVSQQIQALERELGVTLITREPRGFSLTPAGEYFYRRAKPLLEEAESLRRETVSIGRRDRRLRVGYLKSYAAQELTQAMAKFSRECPEAAVEIVNGTHEELYELLRAGAVDLVLSDQRRAFSDEYVNFHLLYCGCCAELSPDVNLASKEYATREDLKKLPCILVSSREQRRNEEDFYRGALGFTGEFIFAETLEEGRLLAAGKKGFLPIEVAGTLPPPLPSLVRLPLHNDSGPLLRNYCAFWKKGCGNPYIESFAGILYRLLNKE